MPTAMGGNAVRLGALVGGPLLACVLAARGGWRRPVVPIVALLAALAVWQWSPAVRDIYKAATDPVAKASYFDPVREYLRLLPDQRRVEIPFTLGHWEGAEVASEAPLARGWLRQLDTGRNPIFYKGGAERADLRQLAVRERRALRGAARRQARPQLLPRARADRARAALPQAAGQRFEHWRIYEVTLPTPIVISRGRRQHHARAAAARTSCCCGCASRARRSCACAGRPTGWPRAAAWSATGDWTRVTADEEGFLRLVTRFAPERVVQRGRRCNAVEFG